MDVITALIFYLAVVVQVFIFVDEHFYGAAMLLNHPVAESVPKDLNCRQEESFGNCHAYLASLDAIYSCFAFDCLVPQLVRIGSPCWMFFWQDDCLMHYTGAFGVIRKHYPHFIFSDIASAIREFYQNVITLAARKILPFQAEHCFPQDDVCFAALSLLKCTLRGELGS